MSRGAGAVLLAALLASDVIAAPRLSGQLAVDVSAGVRYSTALVRDSIVAPFAVRPALAPALAITLTMPLERGWGAQVTLDFSTSALRRHEADGSSDPVGRASTAAFIVGLERRLPAGFSAGIGVGGLKYIPDENSGVFRSGSGSIAGLGTLAVGHRLPFGRRNRFAVEARYDVHGFSTPALRDEGFASPRPVHRVALTIRAGRGGR